MVDVGVVGGSGYGGAELLRLLDGHPALKVRTVAAGSSAGQRLDAVFPHLAGTAQAETVLAPSEPAALEGCAVVFLATPHDVSAALAGPLVDRGAAVIDLSDAFRLDAAPFAENTEGTVYGLPELFRADLPGAHLVANAGCYPTAALLAAAPLAGLVDPDSLVVVGMSGTSGAGRGLREDLHASHAMANVGAYGAPAHRHTPEIAAGWSALAGAEAAVTFVPHLVPMARGLVCTVTATLRAEPGEVRRAFVDRYAGEPFVRLLDESAWPASAHVAGGNRADVGAVVDEAAGRVIASCAIDNLGKGAAGQAIQCANAVLRLPETDGLPIGGVYP